MGSPMVVRELGVPLGVAPIFCKAPHQEQGAVHRQLLDISETLHGDTQDVTGVPCHARNPDIKRPSAML